MSQKSAQNNSQALAFKINPATWRPPPEPRRMHQQYGLKLFIIDSLQLLPSTARRAENRQQEIADISNDVKALAKELSVPIIVLSQLNRELERDKNRKPRMSDLTEFGRD